MRFGAITLVLASLATMTFAQYESFDARSDDAVLNARELLEDLGMHARALKGAALSARRLEQLEVRMLDLEDDIHELVTRAKSDPYVCPVCDATFKTTKELTSHKDSKGHHKKIAPAPARRP
ncbi:hypothetical protein EST38_g5844 [Candolleomyces aberdarensis]|uniref:C2H2-type domain-containing protein n=1 Tax=Candolleomyces aberdarensis TaxID=2316362 RepID=A0A4Q2DLI0_9AGAR|nr:hypothetical protein EST38_g5844 [Candolleomyces aberdarensis]